MSAWVSKFDGLKSEYDLPDDAMGVFAISLRFGLDDFAGACLEAITGGGDDKKCDVLHVDRDRQIAVITQCYRAEHQKPAAPANKASDLNTAVAWLLSEDLDKLPDGLKGRAAELRDAISVGDINQLHIWYVHNLPSSDNVSAELRAVEKTAKGAIHSSFSGRDVAIFSAEVGDFQIEELYQHAENTVAVSGDFEVMVPGHVEVAEEGWSSVTTTVPGKWLYDLYAQYQEDLFSANLRSYLGSRQSDSNINNKIKETAADEPENFYVFNNGITALVHDYAFGRKRLGRERLKITGISIVNGAQTTGSLGSLDGAPPENLQVPIRFVKASNDSLINRVVQFNNSQNKLEAADFRSNDGIQDRLRKEFSNVPDADYEGGRRGGASDAIKRSKFTLPSYTVGQSLAAFHGDPVLAYNKKSEIWTSENNYRRFFTERTTARHIVLTYSLLLTVNSKRHELGKLERDGGSAALTEADRQALRFLNRKGANFVVVHTVSRLMETVLSRSIPNASDLQFSKNISPTDGVDIWNPIVDVVIALSPRLDPAFPRDRVSNEKLNSAVADLVQVVNSLASSYEDKFSEFRSSVRLAGS